MYFKGSTHPNLWKRNFIKLYKTRFKLFTLTSLSNSYWSLKICVVWVSMQSRPKSFCAQKNTFKDKTTNYASFKNMLYIFHAAKSVK